MWIHTFSLSFSLDHCIQFSYAHTFCPSLLAFKSYVPCWQWFVSKCSFDKLKLYFLEDFLQLVANAMSLSPSRSWYRSVVVMFLLQLVSLLYRNGFNDEFKNTIKSSCTFPSKVSRYKHPPLPPWRVLKATAILYGR